MFSNWSHLIYRHHLDILSKNHTSSRSGVSTSICAIRLFDLFFRSLETLCTWCMSCYYLTESYPTLNINMIQKIWMALQQYHKKPKGRKLSKGSLETLTHGIIIHYIVAKQTQSLNDMQTHGKTKNNFGDIWTNLKILSKLSYSESV